MRLEQIQKALAEFRRAQANLQRVMRAKPKGEAGRLEFEAALRAAVEAGDRMQDAANDSNAIKLLKV